MEDVYGYIRVSTQKQGDGVSLIEQKSAIEDYARKNSLRIIRWFEEKVTAAKEGRPAFNEMMDLLSANKADGVCFHKIDRSSRNYGDWNRINILADAGINFYSVSDGINLSDEASRLPADILAAMSTHYIRNLRKETLKGFYGRLKQGYYPLPAPIGYKDMGGGKAKEVDPISAPFIKELFELYVNNNYSINKLVIVMHKKGLRNKKGGKVTRTGISIIIKNPFYIGLMDIKSRGEMFQGNHKPIISKALFDNAQTTISGKANRKIFKHNFPFRRKLKCRGCGYSLIGELQKGHIYYRCHTVGCPTTSVRQRSVIYTLNQFLASMALNDQQIGEVRNVAVKLLDTRNSVLKQKRASYKMQIVNLDNRLDKLTDMLIDAVIDKETYSSKKRKLLNKKIRFEEAFCDLSGECKQVEDKLQKFLEPLESYSQKQIKLCAHQIAQIAFLTTSNLFVQGKKLCIEPIFPYVELATSENDASSLPHLARPSSKDALISEKLTKPPLLIYDLVWSDVKIEKKKKSIDCKKLAYSLIKQFS